MNSQSNPYPPYPQASQAYSFQPAYYPAAQQQYQYPAPQQAQQNQAYSFGLQQPTPQQLQPPTQSSRPTPQPPPHQRKPPASQPQQVQYQQQTPQQQQRQNVQSSPSPSPEAGPGAPAADPNSAEAELERQLMDALNNETEEGQQTMAQLYPNMGDENEPIYRMPPPPESTYPNEEELDRAMHEWSLAHGYELVRRACKKNARGEQYKRYYDCSRHSRKRSKLLPEERKRKNRKLLDSQCPMSVATVAVDPANPQGEWQIRHRKTHHNHPAVEGKQLAGHRRRFRDTNVQRAVDGLFAIGTSTSQVVQFLQRTNPNGLFTRTDVANMKLKWNKHGTSAGPAKESEPRNKAAFKAAGGACHMCRAKHDACEGTRPSCANCVRRGSQCVYDSLRPTIRPDFMNFPPGAQVDLTTVTPAVPPQPQPQPQLQQQPQQVQQQQPQPQQSQQSQNAGPSTNPAPPARGRGRPSKPTQPTVNATEATQILDDLRSFQKDNVIPARLELKSSVVESLVQTTCGTGESYKSLTILSSPDDWENWKHTFIIASMKENTRDVLTGESGEPQRPPAPAGTIGKVEEVQAWNEYIKQLAIYRRRNDLIVSAIWQHLTQYYRNRLHNITKASAVWTILEDTFQPRGCEMAFRLFVDVQSITLSNSNDLKDYINRLESTYEKFKKLPLNRTPMRVDEHFQQQHRVRDGFEAMPEETVCLLFLQNLGPEWRKWVDGLCHTNNIGGFGTGERLGLRELCNRAVSYEAQQKRELGRSR